jgi:hypothetical protein
MPAPALATGEPSAAIDAETKLVQAHLVGKRTTECANIFTRDRLGSEVGSQTCDTAFLQLRFWKMARYAGGRGLPVTSPGGHGLRPGGISPDPARLP